jgi:5'-deoxynucleotidase YfbR-like HD superfamily hydrolase
MTVAEHSYRATMLYIYLGGTEVTAQLTHDAEEAVTSDIPGPIKHAGLVTVSEDLKEKYCIPFQDPNEKKLAKLADILDVVIHIREQSKFSERLAEIYEDELEKSLELARALKKTRDVKKILKEIK